MHNNFEELEARCKRYYLKKILKIVLPVSVVSLVVVIGYFAVAKNEVQTAKPQQKTIFKKDIYQLDDADIFDNMTEKKIKDTIKIKKVVVAKEIQKEKPIKKVKKTKQIQKIVPKRKIEDVEYDLHLYSYNLLDKKRDNVIRKKQLPIKKQPPKIVKQPQPHTNNIPQRIKNKPKVKTDKKPFKMELKNINSIDKMIEIYNSHNSYKTALMISKLYYKKRNYKRAIQWSKKANIISPREEEAWLVYAKSEYALGNKSKAKSILKIYINSSDSKKAKALLISWLKG
jgi:tetratricopeptide (TPR) repeat protein